VDVAFLCTPNNPTGNLLPAAEILSLAHDLAGRALVIVDEAYIEFSGAASLAAAAATTPGLVVLRTLSKAHGLAGARCGALIAQPEIVQLLQRVIQPYAVTQLTIEAVFGALQPANAALSAERVALLCGERDRMRPALALLPGVRRVWPSAGNFLLVEFDSASRALAAAHAGGILLRDFSRTPGLDNCVRVSMGTPEQNDRLLARLA
jgi:histidinol-phosphate aminotransferase